MSDTSRPSAEDLAPIARMVGIPLSAARRAEVQPALAGLLADFQVIVDTDLEETPPAFAFDPRTVAERGGAGE